MAKVGVQVQPQVTFQPAYKVYGPQAVTISR